MCHMGLEPECVNTRGDPPGQHRRANVRAQRVATRVVRRHVTPAIMCPIAHVSAIVPTVNTLMVLPVQIVRMHRRTHHISVLEQMQQIVRGNAMLDTLGPVQMAIQNVK